MTLTVQDLLAPSSTAASSDRGRTILLAFEEAWASIYPSIPIHKAQQIREWLAQTIIARAPFHTSADSLRNEAVYMAVKHALILTSWEDPYAALEARRKKRDHWREARRLWPIPLVALLFVAITLGLLHAWVTAIVFGHDLYAAQGTGPTTLWGTIGSAAFLAAYFWLLRYASSTPLLTDWEKLCFWSSLIVMLSTVAVHLVVMLDTRFGGHLFFPECAAATVKDYYLFVLDNLAKGVLVDALESYNINLYRCAPARHSWIVSTVTFAIRGIATYAIIWAFVETLKMVWKRQVLNRLGMSPEKTGA